MALGTFGLVPLVAGVGYAVIAGTLIDAPYPQSGGLIIFGLFFMGLPLVIFLLPVGLYRDYRQGKAQPCGAADDASRRG